jgi:hypothetical protein
MVSVLPPKDMVPLSPLGLQFIEFWAANARLLSR